MKLSPRPFQILWDAHSVTGIVIGLALFVIFYTGAFTLFFSSIRAWEEPTLRPTVAEGERALPLDDLVAPVLEGWNADPSYLYVEVPNADRSTALVYAATADGPRRAYANAATGAWVDEDGGIGVSRTVYYLHFFYQLGRWGLTLAGIVSLFAMLAIVTGVLIHLHRLKPDFFQFRPRKKLRVAWADAHKVLGTIGLPFTLMYALTGAFFCLLTLVAVPYTLVLFDGDAEALYRAAAYSAPAFTPDSVMTGEPVALQPLVDRAEATWPGFVADNVGVHERGTPTAHVEVWGAMDGAAFGNGLGVVVYHGLTGEVLAQRAPREAGPLNHTLEAFEVLHFAEFGGETLRWLFFFLALASCAVIVTGNLTWLEVRRGQDRRVNRVLARLTAGVATGIAPATALLFLSARLLPAGLPERGHWEATVFFGSWLLATLYALSRPSVARTHRALLAAGGALAVLIPVADGLATGAWPWVTWSAGQWAVLGVDLGALGCGLVALGLAASITTRAAEPPARHPAPLAAPRRPQPVAEPAA